MSLSVDDFDAFHVAVHGQDHDGADRLAFDWQVRLLRQVVRDQAWPRVLNLPTGAGKTTCLDIALFALALDAQDPKKRWCPRRIAMVVDRRVVVDQVAERGRKLLKSLVDKGARPVVREVADRLRSLSSAAEEPVGVFTLRGGMPKDDAWARSPDQPLILASTVDQLGSRLLIQGYGVSNGMKPVHAGLLGNDLLLLLDEVHLSQPFADTLEALGRLRERFQKTSSVFPRFHHAFLSATPGAFEAAKPFRLEEAETSPGSVLGQRLHARKRARLIEVVDRPALENACIAEGRDLAARHEVVAIILNRVASASKVARQLREVLANQADVVLLTGRMRPLDRDDTLHSIRPRVMTGRLRASVERKLVVVATQCIEAGADFDFDALVTESASLDALRQRFGRVDRLGMYGKAEGVIVHDKSVTDDPVYGQAIVKTANWLKPKLAKTTKDLNFGVVATPVPNDEELEELIPPKRRAPVLMPAYLDLWMQTSPPPVAVPEVSLWLHGLQSGPPDVQVVWRTDLTDLDLEEATNPKQGDAAKLRAIAIVAAVRPSSLEAISLPFGAVRRWISGADAAEIVDVEAGSPDDEAPSNSWRVLQWAGDDSEVIEAGDLRPGNTIIVPATRGGIRDGSFAPESKAPVHDLAERAALVARGQAVLRLHPDVLAQWDLRLALEDTEQIPRLLEELAEEAGDTGWRSLWLHALAKGTRSTVVDAREPWIVLQARRRVSIDALRAFLPGGDAIENGVEVTTDDDDSFHAGSPVPLAIHSAHVERLARDYSTAAGLTEELTNDIALAAWLHDVGKADRRFQILLRGGSEIDFLKDETPWAKSGMPSGAKGAHRLARGKSGYPKGARHEIQSVVMVEEDSDSVTKKAHDLDLVLYLIGSHHGHCRPFAPPVIDDHPVDVSLAGHHSETFSSIDFGATSSRNDLHVLDSPLADRFWRLVRKYGWLELCWLETILRLADHRASEMEQESGAVA